MKIFSMLTIQVLLVQLTISQWTQVPNGMGTNRYVYTLTSNSGNLFAGASSGGVYITSNNGNNWQQTSLTVPVIQSLFSGGSYLFAGTAEQGIYYTSNNGTNWVQSSLNNKTIYSFTRKNSALFAGSDSSGVYRSVNNGASWSASGLGGQTIYSMEEAGGLIIAGTADFGMYVSTDEGASWIPVPFFNLAVFDLTADSNIVYAGTSDGLYRSTNYGMNFTQFALSEENVGAVCVSGSMLFAGTFSGGVYVSSDGGAQWQQKNEGLTQLTSSALCILNNYLFNGTQNSVFRRPLPELIGIQQLSSEIPQNFSLSQNYPNPFNPVTHFGFRIADFGLVRLSVYDALGREVTILVDQQLRPGTYEASWDASAYPSGVYFYKLQAGKFSNVKKMILVK